MVLTAYFGLSPVIGLYCHRRVRIEACLRPVGPTCLRKLDAGVEASGPHDFAVRELHLSSARRSIAHGKPALRSRTCPMLPRPPHPVPYVRDDRETPLCGNRTARLLNLIWVRRKRKYFCKWDWTGQIRLIRFNKIAPSCK